MEISIWNPFAWPKWNKLVSCTCVFPLILVVFSSLVYCSVWVYLVYHLFVRKYHFTWFFYYHFDCYDMINIEECIYIVGVMHYIYIEGLNLMGLFFKFLHLGSIDVMLWRIYKHMHPLFLWFYHELLVYFRWCAVI